MHVGRSIKAEERGLNKAQQALLEKYPFLASIEAELGTNHPTEGDFVDFASIDFSFIRGMDLSTYRVIEKSLKEFEQSDDCAIVHEGQLIDLHEADYGGRWKVQSGKRISVDEAVEKYKLTVSAIVVKDYDRKKLYIYS